MAAIPAATTVHELFGQVAFEHSSALAVDAWDGALSYGEVHDRPATREHPYAPWSRTADHDGELQLSPMQIFHLRHGSAHNAEACHTVLLHLAHKIDLDVLEYAMSSTAKKHESLRARFHECRPGTWQQLIGKDPRASYRAIHALIKSDADTNHLTTECRALLNVIHGPSLSAVILERSGAQLLFVAVHHLVADTLSFQIILRELEVLLAGGPPTEVSSATFGECTSWQSKYAARYLLPELSLDSELRPPQLSFWDLSSSSTNLVWYKRLSFTLSRDISVALTGRCCKFYQAGATEVLVACLLYSFKRVFRERNPPVCFAESNTRTLPKKSMDLSETVGCLAVQCPIQLFTTADDNLPSIISKTRSCFRSLPHGGWSYFCSRYLNKVGSKIFDVPYPELHLSYTEAVDELWPAKSLFQAIDGENHIAHTKRSGHTSAVFQVSISYIQSRLVVNFEFDGRISHTDRVKRWVSEFETTLIQIGVM